MGNIEELRQAFQNIDKDNNGYISKKEFKELMKSMGEDLSRSELKEVMAEADNNDDGKISYEEFVVMMQS